MLTDENRYLRNRWYEFGAFFLAILDTYLSYSSGRLLGFEGAELTGYATGPVITAIVIACLSQLIRAARNRLAISKITFFTLVVFLAGTGASLSQGFLKQNEMFDAIDPASLNIEHDKAASLALQIEDSVRKGQTDDIRTLYDADRFMKIALQGQDSNSQFVKSVAQGGSGAFTKATLLDQMAEMSRDGGHFVFVKFYRRDDEPILQFRFSDNAGGLHYIDLYLYKTNNDKLRIADLRYYNTGDRLSKQIIANTADLEGSIAGTDPRQYEQLETAIKLSREGKPEEAKALLDSFPDAFKQRKTVMQLRLQVANQGQFSEADELFREFRERFPDDPSVVFSAFVRALTKDDAGACAALIDEIYKTVRGDDYLLWYKTRLFIAQQDYSKATASLTEMETRYGIEVTALAQKELGADFLSSKQYRAWLREHRPRD